MRLIKNTIELIEIKDSTSLFLLCLKKIPTSRFKQNLIILHHHALTAME